MADSQKKSANIINAASPSEYARTTVTPLTNGGVELSITNATWTNCRYINIPVVANVEYTLSIYIDEYIGTGTFMIPLRQIDGNGTVISTDTITQTGTITHTFTAEGSTVWLGVYLNNSGTAATASAKIRIMLNEGATALPYEPYGWLHSLRKLTTSTDTITTLPADLYADGNNATVGLVGNMQQTGTPTSQNPIQPSECGDLETTGEHAGQYKIPISSASTTTPVYLGEVESTRKIKKYEFTGDEAWGRNSGNSVLYLAISDGVGGNAITSMCTEYPAIVNVASYAAMTDKSICIKSDGSAIWIRDTDISSTTDFKTHLQQQYANGTPVTVWYVLGPATTGIVNEPLRKIGDYADTVSGISIPTISGADSFDVLTTLKPSEVSLTYTGWHDATVKECDGSQWQ